MFGSEIDGNRYRPVRRYGWIEIANKADPGHDVASIRVAAATRLT